MHNCTLYCESICFNRGIPPSCFGSEEAPTSNEKTSEAVTSSIFSDPQCVLWIISLYWSHIYQVVLSENNLLTKRDRLDVLCSRSYLLNDLQILPLPHPRSKIQRASPFRSVICSTWCSLLSTRRWLIVPSDNNNSFVSFYSSKTTCFHCFSSPAIAL